MMTTEPLLIAQLAPGVTGLILNRPANRNALSVALLEGLVAGLKTARADPECRVIVLGARGPVFSAGGDLKDPRIAWVGEPGSSEALLSEATDLIISASQPVISRVQGPVFGGGVGLVAATDIVIVDDTAAFVMSETRLGFAATLATPTLVPRVGMAHALRMMLLGERIGAQEALEVGLATFAAKTGQLDEVLASTLGLLLEGGPAGIACTKALVRAAANPATMPTTSDLYRITIELITADQAKEGAAAASQKRRPAWYAAPPAADHLSSFFDLPPPDGS